MFVLWFEFVLNCVRDYLFNVNCEWKIKVDSFVRDLYDVFLDLLDRNLMNIDDVDVFVKLIFFWYFVFFFFWIFYDKILFFNLYNDYVKMIILI